MAEQLMEQLADAAAVADTDGTLMQIIAAVNDPLARPARAAAQPSQLPSS